MIDFWTFQHKHVLTELEKYNIYFPNFEKSCNDIKKNAYMYILSKYIYNLNDDKLRGRRLNGLVFGLTEYNEVPIKTYNDYCNAIKNMNASGISSSEDNMILLHLKVNYNKQNLLPIDFYRFSDLIYYSSIEGNTYELDGVNPDINIVKRDLFKPNGEKFELIQSHLPYISKDMINDIYPAVEYIDGEFIKSNLKYNID